MAEIKASAPARPDHGPIDTNAYECVRDVDALQAWIARATETGFVAFDTETDALSQTTAALCGISLAGGPGAACSIPVGHAHEHEGGLALETPADLTQVPLETALALLKPLLEDPRVLKIGHNAKYDQAVLRRYGVDVAPIDDTMLLAFALEGGLH